MTETATIERPISVAWEGDRAPFAKAFVAAQKATESIKKAASNPAFKSKYADLAHVVEGVVPALNEAGVGVMQFPSFDGELVQVATTFLHESGSAVTATLALRPSKLDPQGVGSAITYARRYSLLAMTGAAPEDDDGNAASGPREQPKANPNRAAVTAAMTAITLCDDVASLKAWHMKNADMLETLPEADRAEIVRHFNNRKKGLGPATKATGEAEFRGERPEGVAGNGRDVPQQSAADLIGADEIPW